LELVLSRDEAMPVIARLVVVAPVERRLVAKKLVEVAEVSSVLPVSVEEAKEPEVVTERIPAERLVDVAEVRSVLPVRVVEAIDALPETRRFVEAKAVVVAFVPVALANTKLPVSVVDASVVPVRVALVPKTVAPLPVSSVSKVASSSEVSILVEPNFALNCVQSVEER